MSKKSPAATPASQDVWSIKPIIPGPWKTLSLADTCAVVARLTAHEAGLALRALSKVPPSALENEQIINSLSAHQVSFQRARVLVLTALPNWVLVELEATTSRGETALMGILIGPEDRLIKLDWKAKSIIDASINTLPWPPSDEQAEQYIRLFCNAIAGSGERFRSLSSLDHIDIPLKKRARAFKKFADSIEPFSLLRKGATITAHLSMVYRGELFRAEVHLLQSGQVDMVSETPVCPAFVCHEDLKGSFRLVRPDPVLKT